MTDVHNSRFVENGLSCDDARSTVELDHTMDHRILPLAGSIESLPAKERTVMATAYVKGVRGVEKESRR